MSEASISRLPELERVPWRPLADTRRLDRLGLMWTGWTIAHTVPFLAVAVALMSLQPLALPVALVAIAHAWIIPELYAQRGANVVRPRSGAGTGRLASHPAEGIAAGLLGDLLGHGPRDLHRSTGLVLERGRLGAWVVGEVGALLLRPGGRRVHCYCVRVNDATLPPADRIAHLLLALRADERGFATVANLAFVGAPWRVRRRLPPELRPALNAGRELAREMGRSAAQGGPALARVQPD